MDKYNKLEIIENRIKLIMYYLTMIFAGLYFYLGNDEFFVYNKMFGKIAFWTLLSFAVVYKVLDFSKSKGYVVKYEKEKSIVMSILDMIAESIAYIFSGWYVIVSLWNAITTKFALFDDKMWISIIVVSLVTLMYGLWKSNFIDKVNSMTSEEPIFGNTIFND